MVKLEEKHLFSVTLLHRYYTLFNIIKIPCLEATGRLKQNKKRCEQIANQKRLKQTKKKNITSFHKLTFIFIAISQSHGQFITSAMECITEKNGIKTDINLKNSGL